jgi:hypothetical protein
MKWVLRSCFLLLVVLGAAACVCGGPGAAPANAVPFQVEFRDDLTEPRLVISHLMLGQARKLSALPHAPAGDWALNGPIRPVSWAAVLLGLVTGGLCLSSRRRTAALAAVLLGVAIPVVQLQANPVAPGQQPGQPSATAPAAQADLLALPACEVVVEDDLEGLWFRLQLPRSKQGELLRLAQPPR